MERTSAQPQVKLSLLRLNYFKIHPDIITLGVRLVSLDTPLLGKSVWEWILGWRPYLIQTAEFSARAS
jgi:hypothetical protein